MNAPAADADVTVIHTDKALQAMVVLPMPAASPLTATTWMVGFVACLLRGRRAAVQVCDANAR